MITVLATLVTILVMCVLRSMFGNYHGFLGSLNEQIMEACFHGIVAVMWWLGVSTMNGW